MMPVGPDEGNKPGWLQCILLGLLVTPITMFFIYLAVGFMPEEVAMTVRNTFLEYPLLFGLIFYGCGVWLYHWLGLDLKRKDNWPDLPG